MPGKKINKKGGFSLMPITLSEPVKTTDGFTNLIGDAVVEPERLEKQATNTLENQTEKEAVKVSRNRSTVETKRPAPSKQGSVNDEETEESQGETANLNEPNNNSAKIKRLTETELLRILGAESLDEVYELSDVLRASSLKLYAALVRLADSRGRARAKNHELMAEAGIKGIATLYKQERWLTELKLVEKKAKPGPHDGSSYFVFKLETLPLPVEIYNKFNEYLTGLK